MHSTYNVSNIGNMNFLPYLSNALINLKQGFLFRHLYFNTHSFSCYSRRGISEGIRLESNGYTNLPKSISYK